MKSGSNAPRITVTCAGYEGHTCYTQVETTPSHRHDAKCRECKRVIHIASSTRYNQRVKDGHSAESGKRGRKSGGEVRPVKCRKCGNMLLWCKCLDRLDGIARLEAWRW